MKSAVLVLNLLGAFWAQAQSSGPGAALLFNGASNSYAVIQHDPSLNPYPLTVTAWVKTTPTRGSAGLVNSRITPDVACRAGLVHPGVPSDVTHRPRLVDARIAPEVANGTRLVDTRVARGVADGARLLDARVRRGVAQSPRLVESAVASVRRTG